jgi:CO/xanthine dehydrogenase FAD-binding subunit
MTIKTYIAPESLDEAVAALAHEGAIPFAGGTDIIPQTQTGRRVETVVDVKRLAALNVVERQADAWVIGAGVSCRRLGSHAELRSDLPGLVEGATLIGSTQIQGRATLGGNVGNASPAADTVPALLANHAVVEVVGPEGSRTVPVAEVITGPGSTSLGRAEFMVRFVVPTPPGGADAALRFTPRTEMDIAVANAAVRIVLDVDGTCRQADVAIGGVGPRALLVDEAGPALLGLTEPTDDALLRVADACRRAASPIDDKRGTAEFRRHAIGVLASRATGIAWQRAAARRGAGS